MVTFGIKKEVAQIDIVTGMTFGQCSGTDPIKDFSSYLEGLDAETAKMEMTKFCEVRSQQAYILGGFLFTNDENNWYLDYGYETFKEMAENLLGISKTAAYDYIGIYKGLTNSGVSWEEVEHIGWTKIRVFAKYLTNENKTDWIGRAEELSAIELRNFATKEKGLIHKKLIASDSAKYDVPDQQGPLSEEEVKSNGNLEPTPEPALIEDSVVENKSHSRPFKFYIDQEETVNLAIKYEMEDSGTKYEAVALENICKFYLSFT